MAHEVSLRFFHGLFLHMQKIIYKENKKEPMSLFLCVAPPPHK
jgi:hypothetical protein